MKKTPPILLVSTLFLTAALFFIQTTDTIHEVNAKTGEVRTRVRKAHFFTSPWSVRSTWVADLAKSQGISTGDGWQALSVVSKRFFMTSRACRKAPASYVLAATKPEDLDLTSSQEKEQWVREFISGDEFKREKILLLP